MPDLKDILNNEAVKKLMADKSALEHLQNAPETQQLFTLLQQKSGSSAEQLASTAAGGENSQLMGVIQQLLRDPESQKLLSSISKKFPL